MRTGARRLIATCGGNTSLLHKYQTLADIWVHERPISDNPDILCTNERPGHVTRSLGDSSDVTRLIPSSGWWVVSLIVVTCLIRVIVTVWLCVFICVSSYQIAGDSGWVWRALCVSIGPVITPHLNRHETRYKDRPLPASVTGDQLWPCFARVFPPGVTRVTCHIWYPVPSHKATQTPHVMRLNVSLIVRTPANKYQ